MKKLIVISIISGVAAVGSTALASPGGGHKGHGSHFDKLDADGDGVITRSEMDARHRDFFDAADANRDGKVTREEMQAFHKARRAEMRGKRMGDANGDGVVTRAEFDAAAAERFKKLDKNGDGVISADEMESAREGRRGGKR